jgi:hypothetical protein
VTRLRRQWAERELGVTLVVLDSPYREITNPVLDHVNQLREAGPRDLVVVYIPEYVVGRWWEQLLHNQSALRLKARLLFQRRIMVVSVPWQLESSRRRPRRDTMTGGRRPDDREPVSAGQPES